MGKKDTLIDLRKELDEEFKEINPSLSINFLTLDKFFSYLAEELKLGKSKSALQLFALDDTKEILANYEDNIAQSIKDYLMTINIDEELDEEYLNNAMAESIRQFSANLKTIETAIKPMQVNNGE